MADTATAALSPAKPAAHFLMLDPRHITPDPDQPRREFDENALAELADSIGAHGVIEPIIVRSCDGTDTLLPDVSHMIIAGERRWRASMLAGIQAIPALVRDDLAGQDLRVVQVLENLQRADLTLPETARGVAALVEALGTTKTAAQLGKSEGWVSKHARIYELPEAISGLVDGGHITSADIAHDLHRICELTEEAGGAYGATWRRDDALKDAGQGVLTRAAAREHIDAIKGLIKRLQSEREEEARRQEAATNAAQGTFNMTPEQQREDAEETRRQNEEHERWRQAQEARRQKAQALDAELAPQATALVVRAYAALGIEVPRNEDGEIDLDTGEWGTPGCDVIVPGAWSEDPMPTGVDDCPLLLQVPVTLRQATAIVELLERGVPADTECLQRFVRDCTTAADDGRVKCSEFLAAYNRWLSGQGITPVAPTDERWPSWDAAAGLQRHRLNSGRVYVGIALID
jgi:ParB/RepB/Spo0J family partition protein